MNGAILPLEESKATDDAQGTEAGKKRLLRPAIGAGLASFLTNASASLALQPYDGY